MPSNSLTAITVLHDDFTAGLRHEGPDAPWSVRPAGDLPAGDATVSASPAGLLVESRGRNAKTGDPAFSYATGPGGPNDHLKWSVLARGHNERGLPGFDLAGRSAVTASARLSARSFGTGDHPFGPAVTDADADPRLAAAAFILADVESGLVCDLVVSGTAIHALYERLPARGGDRAAFSYAVPVATRRPDDVHTLAIRYETDGVVRWFVDGGEVLNVSRPGYRCLDGKWLVIDHGGEEQPARPRQLTTGLSLLALLDAAGPDGRGLVRLNGPGYRAPAAFVDERGSTDSRLWGQGVRMAVREIEVTAES